MNSADPQADPLDVLRVIDRLVVGPVRVEPRRMVAPYVVHRDDRAETFELVYRWEEDVFRPADAASENLAAMIGAQVALNYGLFCDEIAFHGPLDADDRQFLREMAENTAREILVKKILHPNPFLTSAARGVPPVRRPSYLNARLTFPDAAHKRPAAEPWAADPRRACVLSSGGKDSLLSHGLLDELGQQVHPVFVNESGRHWYTALNAYRHFAAHVPHTARVWTNCDRLFSWMLRQLPFVRPDFARLRADVYPVRLWTVAVFLFGALPLVRKRGLGRLVIGDEFDTTDRGTYEGITHYNGLYDQSRYFDRYLTAYFRRKGWNLEQFSILRPLSEMLIEKVLVERYPQLQRLQLSCHASHGEKPAGNGPPALPPGAPGPPDVEQDAAAAEAWAAAGHDFLPCGNCEKCTRIVGMLRALGADPARCGYTPEQIDKALKNLAARGAALERPALEHLGFLLQQRGLLPGAQLGGAAARQHPEIMQLRFDPQRSPIDDVPPELRRPLYAILLEHAAGAVRRVDRTWSEFDLLNDPALAPF